MRLIKKGLVQFVASDAHSDSGRNPDMRKAALIEKHSELKRVMISLR